MSSPPYILFIFEGQILEQKILSTIHRCYSQVPDFKITTSWCTNLYGLAKALKEDDDLDIVQLIRERYLHLSKQPQYEKLNLDRHEIHTIPTSKIQSIYLFFDYDAHDRGYSDKKIIEMLDIFSNDSEHGKLYVSYPMAEAIKDTDLTKSYIDIFVNQNEFKKYKNAVSKRTKIQDVSKINAEQLGLITYLNVLKPLVHLQGESDKKHPNEIYTLDQKDILHWQLSLMQRNPEKVATLSSFPFFIFDHFKKESLILSQPATQEMKESD